jgi:transposase
MDITEEHYEKLLGLSSPWSVKKVDLSVEKLQVDIHVEHVGQSDNCPECGESCRVYDHSPERTWRHLDTMQFTTLLHCSAPRVECSKHGVKTVALPWAGKHSRFTLLFEAFSIKVLEVSRSTEEARKLLKLNWQQLNGIMKRAVARGLERRHNTEIPWTGMDEKSFRKGYSYITIMTDLEDAKVLDVVEGRESADAKRLISKALNEKQREMVCGVAIDMSAPFESAIKQHLPHADIVHDKFHISKHLNEAVDKTRRKEHRMLLKKKDQRLKGTKYTWLRGMEQLSDDNLAQIETLKSSDLKVAKAWYVKELFRHFWTRRDAQFAQTYFDYWYKEAMATGLSEVRKVARTLKRHLSNILTYFESYITNAVSEGINSKIQTIKSNARGFRSFENYRISILFYCGKLNLAP